MHHCAQCYHRIQFHYVPSGTKRSTVEHCKSSLISKNLTRKMTFVNYDICDDHPAIRLDVIYDMITRYFLVDWSTKKSELITNNGLYFSDTLIIMVHYDIWCNHPAIPERFMNNGIQAYDENNSCMYFSGKKDRVLYRLFRTTCTPAIIWGRLTNWANVIDKQYPGTLLGWSIFPVVLYL